MTDPNQPHRPSQPGKRRAEPKRAARPERSARPPRPARAARPARPVGRSQLAGFSVLSWLRSTPGLIVFAVVVIGVAFLIRFLVNGDDDKATGPSIPGAVNGTYGTGWTTVDGSAYEIAIETLSDLGQGQSGTGCLVTPPAGMANLSFRVILTNKSAGEADVPRVDFGTDLGNDGGVDPAKQAFGKSNKRLEITPLAAGSQNCKSVARLGPERGKIAAGESLEFRATFGPIKVPATIVPTVVYRYFAAEGGEAKPTVLLAPFVRF